MEARDYIDGQEVIKSGEIAFVGSSDDEVGCFGLTNEMNRSLLLWWERNN